MSIVVRKPGFRIARSYEVRFSPKGDRLASIAVHVDMWDVASRTRVARGHPFKHPSSVDFSPDGTKLAVKSTSGEIVVLDASSLDLIARHEGPEWGGGAEVFFSPGGEYLVDGGFGGLFVRDAMTGEVVLRENGERTVVQQLACTPDRQRWVQAVWRYPPENDVIVTVRPWPFFDDGFDFQADSCDAVALDPAASLLALVSGRGTDLSVWSLSTPDGWPEQVSEASEFPISGTGRALAWAPSGDLLALAGAGATRLFTRELRETWQTELEFSSSVAFSPSGDLLALGAWSKGFVIATPG